MYSKRELKALMRKAFYFKGEKITLTELNEFWEKYESQQDWCGDIMTTGASEDEIFEYVSKLESIRPWKFWFQRFDKNGNRIGSGVSEFGYKSRPSAERAARMRHFGPEFEVVISKTNPFAA